MDFGVLFKAFVEHPAAAVAAGEALALVYIFRELMKSQASNLQTAMSIAPIAAKLAEAVDAVERILGK